MEKNRAFEQMTIEDARWMGRQIAQLTEPQIQQASSRLVLIRARCGSIVRN
jgi:hypothetical protein